MRCARVSAGVCHSCGIVVSLKNISLMRGTHLVIKASESAINRRRSGADRKSLQGVDRIERKMYHLFSSDSEL